MNIHSDFEEFLRLLNQANARFVVWGGYAVAYFACRAITCPLASPAMTFPCIHAKAVMS